MGAGSEGVKRLAKVDWLGPAGGAGGAGRLGDDKVWSGAFTVVGRRGRFLLRREGVAAGDEVFHGDDHGEGLDLTVNAASGHFGAEVRDFPEAVQYLFAVQALAVQSLGWRCSPSASCWTSCRSTAARCSSM